MSRPTKRNASQLAYTAIRIEGGLIPAEELSRLTTLAAPEATEQTETHYAIPRGLKLRDEIARSFKIAQNLWQDFVQQRHRQDVPAHQLTVNTLLLPLLRQVLGHTDLAAARSVLASGSSQQSYNIGHAALGGRLPVVLAGYDQPLDLAAERFGDTNPDTGRTRRRSPYMLAQEALNASDQSLWAIVSNGVKLRILRDNPSLTRPAYVEVDLEAIFTEELYADFTAFWLLAHASRFGKTQQDGTHTEPTDCPWERWRSAGQKSGETVRMNLRFQVEHALRSLGTGFLSHQANTSLREQLQNPEQSSATKQAFFEELLSLVYRFIFLATVEDRTDPSTGRSLIFTPDATEEQQQRYWQGYSLTWLRERAVRRSSHDTHSDLWQALSITFNGLATGQAALGLPALGGLFAQEQCPLLNQCQIDNRNLLAAVFQLGYFRQSTGLTRVNYRDMGAEELGSVYESLLELVPDYQHLSQPHAARLAFVGDEDDASNKGNARKLTGSYYTPDSLVQDAHTVERLADDTLDGIAAKRSAWAQASQQAGQSTLAKLADTYVAAFLAPKVPQGEKHIPLSGYLWGLLHPNPHQPPQPELAQAAHDLCRAHSVFHWWLAFPQVAAKGGFAVMLGNPPWERIKLQEEEFFATRSPLVAAAKNKAGRAKRIELLRQGLLLHTLYPDVEAAEGLSPPNRAEMRLHEDFIAARRGAEAASLYAHDSGRYPLTGVGDVNTYALFAETFSQLINVGGRAGFIVQSDIALADSCKAYFASISEGGRVKSLHDFMNLERLFPHIDTRNPRFCLLTLGSPSAMESATFSFGNTNTGHLLDSRRQFTLSPAEFVLLNPNTKTSPTFRSQHDAELTKKLYRAAPVLIREAEWAGEGKDARCTAPEVNPWGIRFSTMFHMSNDSHLFADSPAEAHASAPTPRRLPLYEAKMVHQFDHRWATYVDNPDKPGGLDTNDVSPSQKADPRFTVRPRYWVDEREVLARIARVPSRVANAWLAWQQATDAAQQDGSGRTEQQALQERHTALTLALATWVAGAMFRTEAERLHATHPAPSAAPDTGSLFAEYEPNRALAHAQQAQAAINAGVEANAARWSNTTVLRATETTERLLASHHPLLADALKADGTSGKKALPLFQKWALQDDPHQGLGLSSDELAHLQALQTPGITHMALDWLNASMDRRSPRWLIGCRKISRSTDMRTIICGFTPRASAGDSVLIFEFANGVIGSTLAVANLNSLVLDFAARQKLGGINITFMLLKQLAVLSPERYTPADLAYIVPRVLELTHTAHDMQAWADDLLAALPSADPRPPEQHGTPLPPFPWNPERRAQLRAELDAYYARLYGLTRDELRYILDPADVMGADYPSETFRVLKNNEMREFGEYRTQRLVLAAWDRLEMGEWHPC